MTTQRQLLVLVGCCALITTVASTALGDVRRQTPERRPYIVEIGEPYSISTATLDREAGKIVELSEYLHNYGYPDYVEIQEIEPRWPWESYEVRLYYLHRNIETDFGHVFFSPAMPNLGVLKFQGQIEPDKRHQIEVILQARHAPQAPAVAEPAGAAVPVETMEQTTEM